MSDGPLGYAGGATEVRTCESCGVQFPSAMLACPSCGKLAHSKRLAELAAEAKRATEVGNRTEAMGLWREAMELLPPTSAQFQSISEKVSVLGREIDAGAPRGTVTRSSETQPNKVGKPRLGVWGAAGAVAIAILSKGKLLLAGLKGLPVVLSMLASIGVYWAVWNWKFAVGLVLCIYVHEMGHVWQLRKYGMKATAPMFIPGLGALIRLQQRPNDPREDGRIGLAGPEWGLAASLVCLVLYIAGAGRFFGALAEVSAWVNLFNLTPFGSLDGGRAFRAMSRGQRWAAVGTVIALWGVTYFYGKQEGMMLLLAAVGVVRAWADESAKEGNGDVFWRYLILAAALMGITMIHVRM